MFSDESANELMEQVLELVCSACFDSGGGLQCSGAWPEGKEQPLFEIRVHPSAVELPGGKDDGAVVYQGFRVDLRALQEALFPLFEEIEDWELDNTIGQVDDLAKPAVMVAGKLKGSDDDTLTIYICTAPPEDAEPATRLPLE